MGVLGAVGCVTEMPTLDWIGKQAVIGHHETVPFRLLERVPELSVGDAESGNLLMQGDNLEALKALLPRYAGRVKLIYIDPPYNTGSEGWVYNDNVNSPEMKAWLEKTVGRESEDLSRHDKWLCMMYPRLKLLHEFLRDDGVIFVSLDDNEFGSLKLLLDEIFGFQNRVGTIIWKNVTDNNPTRISVEHEYVVCYAKNLPKSEAVWKSTELDSKKRMLEIEAELTDLNAPDAEMKSRYRSWLRLNKPYIWPFGDYKFIDRGGIFTGIRGVHNPGREGYRYPVIHPETGKACVEPMNGYRFPKSTMDQLIESKKIIFGDDETKIIGSGSR